DPLDSVDVWTMAIRRSDNEMFGPFKQLENQYIPRRSILLVRLVHQLVPASEQTHVGVYDYVAYCGNYSDEVDLWDIWDSYSFEVAVTYSEDRDQDRQSWEWNNYNWEHGYIVQLQPEVHSLSNHPNPFNEKTTISFDLMGDSRVNLSIYNIAGQKIVELIDGSLNSGTHKVTFDAENLASGVYFYKISTEYEVTTKRMTLLR
ncbi:MAG: T9SS type A sorting domain-containing protein, partial [candidate division Zixibacteria bacterium]|nr:T9SS type A sorting domain-containing protein [candidate division Zixibacteria bacterium]